MPIPTVPVTDVRAPLRDEVHDLLLDAIVTGRLKPGQALVDDELLDWLGTSKQPLREALNLLALERLVDIVPRRSTHVSELDPLRARDHLEIVGAIYAYGFREGVPLLTEEDRRRLREYRDVVLGDRERVRDAIRTSSLATDLYEVPVRRLGNPELDRAMGWLTPYLRRVNALLADSYDVDEAMQEQRGEIDATLAGDAAKAAALWDRHLARLLSNLAPTASAGMVLVRGGGARSAAVGAPLMRQVVEDQIREAILDGTLLPGEALPETALMTWLRVSRSPIRDAMTRLAVEGLVEQQVHRTSRVASCDAAQFPDLVAAQRVLRVLAARKAAAAGISFDAAAVTAEIEALAAATSAQEQVRVLRRLTALLDVAVDNPVLVDIAGRLSARMLWMFVTETTAAVPFDPVVAVDLVDAIARGDVDGAGAFAEALLDGLG